MAYGMAAGRTKQLVKQLLGEKEQHFLRKLFRHNI